MAQKYIKRAKLQRRKAKKTLTQTRKVSEKIDHYLVSATSSSDMRHADLELEVVISEEEEEF